MSIDSDRGIDPSPVELADTASSEAPATAPSAAESSRTAEPEVHFHFPITVEIIGAVDPELEARIIARVFEELNDELASRP